MAQSGVLTEAGTLPGKSLLEDLFLELPADSRFNQVVIQKFPPATGANFYQHFFKELLLLSCDLADSSSQFYHDFRGVKFSNFGDKLGHFAKFP